MTTLLKVPAVARHLQCSPALVYALCSEGRLPHIRLGLGRGTIRIAEEDLAEFLRECRSLGRLPEDLKHISMPSSRRP